MYTQKKIQNIKMIIGKFEQKEDLNTYPTRKIKEKQSVLHTWADKSCLIAKTPHITDRTLSLLCYSFIHGCCEFIRALYFRNPEPDTNKKLL